LKLIPKSSRIFVPLCSTSILFPPISLLPPMTSIETIHINPIAQLFTGTSFFISSYCASTITSLILLRTWSGRHVRSLKKFLSPYAACVVIIPIFCAGSTSHISYRVYVYYKMAIHIHPFSSIIKAIQYI
jgi:hypothetical protein